MELRPGPAPTPGAGYGESVEVCELKQAAGYPASAVLKFGMMKGLAGSLESSPKASEERAKTEEFMNNQIAEVTLTDRLELLTLHCPLTVNLLYF